MCMMCVECKQVVCSCLWVVGVAISYAISHAARYGMTAMATVHVMSRALIEVPCEFLLIVVI